ncbi:MAG: rhomboid family intramembrane serine protease [Elusimicrobia bacterium]|jgi:membrane associated rhomboid family serine protease|nr:MAG: rhomboid family intramembrane serine protease [Elusimicrobiota bacterium]
MIPIRDNVVSRTFPIVNILLVLANIAVFVLELRQPSPAALERFFGQWALIPAVLFREPEAHGVRVLTSMFLHGGWSHLIGNMMYLWIFGDNVEDRVGHFRYLIFYLLVGVAAGLAQSFLFPASTVPMVGASGAIAGIMGAYFVLYPGSRVTAIVPIFIFLKFVEIPAVLFLGLWFVVQAFQGYGALLHTAAGKALGGGVAWWAHGGGFVAGLILIFFFRRPRRY